MHPAWGTREELRPCLEAAPPAQCFCTSVRPPVLLALSPPASPPPLLSPTPASAPLRFACALGLPGSPAATPPHSRHPNGNPSPPQSLPRTAANPNPCPALSTLPPGPPSLGVHAATTTPPPQKNSKSKMNTKYRSPRGLQEPRLLCTPRPRSPGFYAI